LAQARGIVAALAGAESPEAPPEESADLGSLALEPTAPAEGHGFEAADLLEPDDAHERADSGEVADSVEGADPPDHEAPTRPLRVLGPQDVLDDDESWAHG